MTDVQFKTYESLLRRMAQRQGLRMVKSRRRDKRAEDYGLYVLVEDTAGNRFPGAQAPISAFRRGEGLWIRDIHLHLAQDYFDSQKVEAC